MKLVYIEWADAVSPPDSWKSKDEILQWSKEDSYWVGQVGWILEENEKHIILSPQHNRNEKVDGSSQLEDHYAHVIKIPKTWIRKRKTLKI